MKAIIYEAYGGPEVLTYTTIAKPKPKSKEILIKVVSTSVSHGDIRMRAANPVLARLHSGLLKPKKYPVLGFECAGIVDEIGNGVTNYSVDDEVMVFAGLGFGAYAEYMTVQVEGDYTKGAVVKKPKNITFDEAAACPVGGITALGFLIDLGIKNGKDKNILILGASGSVGSFGVQIAKSFGAYVTGVTSTKNVEMVQNIGADRVIDYKIDDIILNTNKFDMIFDAVGLYKKSDFKKKLTTNGKYVSVKGSPSHNDEILNLLSQLIENAQVKPVIDTIYQWDEIIKAHSYVDQGHKVGNVVLKVSDIRRLEVL